MVKASDFRSVFGRVTHKNPVFKHAKGSLNLPVRGANADDLKFPASLCQQCNNARTQPHDRAWEALSASVRAAKPMLRRGDRIPLARIYPGTVKESLLGVHLYFLKQLGCHVVESQIPLPVPQFGACILAGMPHPSVRLVFASVAPEAMKYKIQVGDVNAVNRGGKTVSAVWHYQIEGLGVLVCYAEPGHPRLIEERGWHPNDVGGGVIRLT